MFYQMFFSLATYYQQMLLKPISKDIYIK